MKLTFVILFLALFSAAGSKDKVLNYPVPAIPEKMKQDAYAVCRDYSHVFEIKNYGSAVEKVKIVITILNEKGDDFSTFRLPYSPLIKITSINGKSYNALGLQDEKLKSSSIHDVNFTSSGAMYDDYRMKVAEFKGENYPYTIEYQYEIEYVGLLNYPTWTPIDDYRISVEKSSFKIIWPEKLQIRYKELNLPANCKTVKKEEGKNIIEWKLDTIAAIREEPYMPEIKSVVPVVITAPVQFDYEGTSGNMTSWNEFGKWNWKLNEGRDVLPPQRKAEIRDITGVIKDTLQAVRKLYEYMQKRTRYVGIQLGIGGFQPFPAETVDRLGYGDCKALSNYMKAILKCVDIPSIYTLAGVGYNEGIQYADFPSIGQNNHAVLCVPLKNDSIWLECTSQTNPCGYFSTYSANRTVMLVTNKGGILTKTPLLNAKQNGLSRKAELNVEADGSMNGTVKVLYSGYQYDSVEDNITKGYPEQEKELLSNISIPGVKISQLNYSAKKERIPSVLETYSVSSSLFATKSGNRMFITPNVFNKISVAPEKNETRKYPFEKKYDFFDSDSVIIKLPAGFQIETIPKQKTYDTEFGKYNATFSFSNNTLVYVREMTYTSGKWPKEKYGDFTAFYTNILNADRARLVLKQP